MALFHLEVPASVYHACWFNTTPAQSHGKVIGYTRAALTI